MNSACQLEIVVPVYNEEEVLPELSNRLARACETSGLVWRIIFVDDGSRDRTAEILRELHDSDERFCSLHLSRNFGHQAALAAGLRSASADAVVVIDGDLQDPPELIPELVRAWREDGAGIVIARRRSRREKGVRRMGFDLFHRFFRYFSDVRIPPETGTFGLLSRPACRAFNRLDESNRFFPGLRAWIGFRQSFVEYDREERAGGLPKQTFLRLVSYAFNAIFSFSKKPLRFLFLLGCLISILGFLLAAIFVVKRLAGIEEAEMGFTTLVTLILVLGGGQLAALGLVGEYIGRIYDEVKRRPQYFIASRNGLDEE